MWEGIALPSIWGSGQLTPLQYNNSNKTLFQLKRHNFSKILLLKNVVEVVIHWLNNFKNISLHVWARLTWTCLCSSATVAFLLCQLPTSRVISPWHHVDWCCLSIMELCLYLPLVCQQMEAITFSCTYVASGNRITEVNKTYGMQNQIPPPKKSSKGTISLD